MSYRIRPVTVADVPECVSVIRESFLTVAGEFGITRENAPRFTAFAISPERLAWQMREGRPMFVCEADGVPVGYFSLEIKNGGVCELNNLAVLPAYRHRGIGAELLSHAKEEARRRGCTVMHIGIVEENTRLRRWYEAAGFTHTGTEKFDFFPFTCGYMEWKPEK